MATNTRLVTFNAQNVTPQDDALLYETAIPQTGIIYGANLTANGTNTVHIETGFGIVRGRFFEIFESDIAIPLSASGEIQGRIIGRLDLANIDEPFVILAQTGTLAPLRQDADVNIFNGVHEFLLATFMVNELTISNFQDVKPTTFGSMTIVDTLPTEGVMETIYLVPHTNGLYQYVWDGTGWKPLGEDLSDYAKLNSPTFIGTPKAPSASDPLLGDTQIATTKFVQDAVKKRFRIDTYNDINVQSFIVPSSTDVFLELDALKATEDGFKWGLVRVSWPNNANGRRYVEIQRKRGDQINTTFATDSRNACQGGPTHVTLPFLIYMRADDVIRIKLWQNSGGSLTANTIFGSAVGFKKHG